MKRAAIFFPARDARSIPASCGASSAAQEQQRREDLPDNSLAGGEAIPRGGGKRLRMKKM